MADIDPAAVMAAHEEHVRTSDNGCASIPKASWFASDEHCEPYRLAEPLARLDVIAQERCETYAEGSGKTCADELLWHEGDYYGRAPNAPYGANRYCPPCRVRAALAGHPAWEVGRG